MFNFRYVRVVGTLNTVNRVFHLVALECSYTNKPFVLYENIIGKYFVVNTFCINAMVVI